MIDLVANLNIIQQRIYAAEQRYGRTTGSVSLLAVSKTHSAGSISTLINAGQSHFGENYLQEALNKMSALTQKSIVWHFIGPLQSKKIQDIAQNFTWVHTVSRLKEAQLLSHFRPRDLPPLQICIQVKLDNSPTKSGIAPNDIPELITAIKALPQLNLRGLMIIPPFCENFAEQRNYFKVTQNLYKELNYHNSMLDTLSMGMTHDLEAAIASGATIIRIGTGIFGPRED